MLVPAESDEQIWDYFATAGIPDEAQVERILDALIRVRSRSRESKRRPASARTRAEGLLKLLAVDEVAKKEREGWVATGKRWYYDEAKWRALREVRAEEADLMRHYAHGDGCLMQFLQQALDDPDPQRCGHCSVCDGQLPAPGAAPSAELVAAASRFFRGQDVVVEPRKLWPGGTPGHKGKLTAVAEGRALAFADDPAWNDVIAGLWQRDQPASEEVLAGMVEVLRRWSKRWFRPTAIVPMPSRRFPILINSVTEHLGRVGRLPVVEALTVTGLRPTENTSSIVRVKDLLATTSVRDDVQLAGPVLLVDDTIRTRWTSTVAAELLGSVGAAAVLPLAIHQLP